MRQTITLAAAAVLLTSCQTVPRASEAGTVETHDAMVRRINPAAMAIWEVSDNAKSEAGGLDPALMNARAWAKITRAAQSLERASRDMAAARTLKVGAHTAVEPGFADRDEIQARLDANPDWFRALSGKLADDAHELQAAAVARDLQQTRDLAQNLNEACQTCHTRYWEKPGA